MEEKNRKSTGFGLAIGIAIGTSLGVAFDNIALGVGIGVALGVGIGIVFAKKEPPNSQAKSTQHPPAMFRLIGHKSVKRGSYKNKTVRSHFVGGLSLFFRPCYGLPQKSMVGAVNPSAGCQIPLLLSSNIRVDLFISFP